MAESRSILARAFAVLTAVVLVFAPVQAYAFSRVKDLVDLALLIGDDQLDEQRIMDALQLTFARRGTHALPASLPVPPEDWETPFRALAEECGLDLDIAAVFETVRKFFENAIKGGMNS